MKKRGIYAPSLLFLLTVSLLFAAFLLAPDRGFSESENRILSAFPKFSAKKLMSGEWTAELENYITDQFPLREQWIGAKAACEKIMLKTENEEVYFAEKCLIAKPEKLNTSDRLTAFGAVNKLAKKLNAPVFAALVPNSVCVNSALLPANAYDGEQLKLLSDCGKQLSQAKNIDVASPLLQSDENYLFYRTDHHPTSRGAYIIYKAIARDMGLEPFPAEHYEVTEASRDFRGTAASKSGAWWVKPDSVELFCAKNAAFTAETSEGEVLNGVFDMAKLDIKDKYQVFLGGNHPAAVIKNENGAKGRLLIIKDSFANCVAPFLAEHFEQTHLLDPRYYRSSVAEYAEKNGITCVLILYSVENFLTDSNIVLVGR